MSIKQTETEMTCVQKPQVFLKNITFNDETQIKLNRNSIVIFTGANNSGKSQVLRDVEKCLDAPSFSHTIVVKENQCEYLGAIDEKSFLSERFFKDNEGHYHLLGTGNSFPINVLRSNWAARNLNSGLSGLFVKRLCTELRLTASDALKRNSAPEKNPIFKLNKSEALAEKISGYFRQAFGVDLVVNRNEMQEIPLHVGQAPDKKLYTIDRQDEYYNQVASLPKLEEQGDGMRSFASILLDTFTSEHTITLIDEPEAFLHPPQARMLGKMFAKNNPDNRQLLISTHSADFLQGLLDADNENVTVIRINRVGNINQMSVLQNEEIKMLWSNPIMRYSDILSGLFHEKVVVCESDYDCLFYQAVMNAIYESKNEIAPDVQFTHCGGKSRIKDVTKALKAVNVPVAAICDFDVLNARQNLRPLVESLGLEWENLLSTGMKTIYEGMNTKKSTGTDAWAQIKKVGKAGFTGDEPAAYERVESLCRSAGLFIVPVGEMECFDRTTNKEKKEWVYEVLEKYDLAAEAKLEDARRFIQAVVDYKPKSSVETCERNF